jgi:CRP/FNR family transcriptional regulator
LELLARRSEVDMVKAQISVNLPMTRDQIANFLGLTLETVSRQLNAMKKDGIIGFSGRKELEVLNVAALRDATGDDADGGMII